MFAAEVNAFLLANWWALLIAALGQLAAQLAHEIGTPLGSVSGHLQLALSNGLESMHNSWDGSYFHTARIAAKRAYDEAGIKRPRDEVSACRTSRTSSSRR